MTKKLYLLGSQATPWYVGFAKICSKVQWSFQNVDTAFARFVYCGPIQSTAHIVEPNSLHKIYLLTELDTKTKIFKSFELTFTSLK